jgi:hypothetical protein
MFTNNVVTRFPNGITNNDAASAFNGLPVLDPTKVHMYFEDFDLYTAGDWTITATGAGTEALTNVNGGVLLLTCSAADNDNIFYQKVGASFLPTAGKAMWFATRFATSDATQSDIVVGLQIVDTTPLDVTDGIYFLKADDAATVSLIARKNATTGSVTGTVTGTLVNATYTKLAWFYDGVDRVWYAQDGTILGSVDASSTFLPDTILTVSFGIQNGEAVAKTLSMDYLMVAMER